MYPRTNSGLPRPPSPAPSGHPLPQAGEGKSTPLARLRERGWGRGCASLLPSVLPCLSNNALAEGGAIYRAPLSQSAAVTPSVQHILLGFLLVAAAIAALLWLLKKARRSSAGGGLIRVLASCPLSPRERLLLVAVGKQQILLASSSAGITALHVLPEPLAVPDESSAPAFAAQLAALMPSLQRGQK